MYCWLPPRWRHPALSAAYHAPLAVELNVDLRCLLQVTTDRPHAEASFAPTAGTKMEDGATLDATQLDENADTVSVARATRAAKVLTWRLPPTLPARPPARLYTPPLQL